MTISKKRLEEVKVEIERLQKRIETLELVGNEDLDYWRNPKEHGAIKRASMDLTRALARLRSSQS